MSQWTTLLSQEQLQDFYTQSSKLDPRFAITEKQYYETRSIAQLRALSCGAWTANDAFGYQMARSYLAIAERN